MSSAQGAAVSKMEQEEGSEKVLLMSQHRRSKLSDILEDLRAPLVDRGQSVESSELIAEAEKDDIVNEDSPSEKLNSEVLHFVPVSQIKVGRYQTREFIEADDLNELSESISRDGVLQPVLLVATSPEENLENPGPVYELVSGERRFRAAKLAGLTEIPARIMELSELQKAALGIVENVQREDLSPVEEALSYQILVKEFRLPQKEIAEMVGKSRVSISNSLRLLALDEEVLDYLKNGDLTAGHGRALLRIEDPALQRRIARRSVASALSVRGLEHLVERIVSASVEEPSEEEQQILASRRRAENRLRKLLDLDRISVSFDPQGRKRVQLIFDSESDWRRFLARIRD